MDKTLSTFATAAAAALVAAALPAHATEGGTSMYPNGTENFLSGALPPPGLYGMVFGNHYSADRVNDNSGNDLHIPGFKVTANVIAGRLAWLPATQILGGQPVVHVIVPVVDLKVDVPGASQSKTGIGDVTFGPGLGWHHSANLHSVVAVDFFSPTGRYDKNDVANVGKNHWGWEPVYAVSWIDPAGFNGDIKLGYTVNRRNKDTNYTSGNEFHFDYAAGYGLGNGWTLGVGGYFYRQTTNDEQAGITVPDNKGRAQSIGPNVKFDSGKGWFAMLKWEKEFGVRNRAEGNALWLKVIFPL